MPSYSARHRFKPWRARAKYEGKSLTLGYFPTYDEALTREQIFWQVRRKEFPKRKGAP